MLMVILPRLALLSWLIASFVTVYGTMVAMIHLTKKRMKTSPKKSRDDVGLDPISILKPLKGIDEGIEENLESFLQLEYPQFEILFSVADPLDPVVPIVNKLMARYPRVNASLTFCAMYNGPNPKINNLLSIYAEAAYDWILISDSNTRVSPQHLRLLGQEFKNGIAMQTSVVAGTHASGLGGLLESAFLNTFYARSVLTLNTLGHPCVIGKAMLFRKSVLEATGGLRSLEVHIAEDYAAGHRLHQLGFRVQVSRTPIRQFIGLYAFKTFWSRHIRWGRLRKMQTPIGFALEPFFSPILAGILGAWASAKIYGSSPFVFFGIHLAVWFACDFILYTRVADRPRFNFIFIWALREVLHFPLWAHILAGNSINWRGKIIHLKRPAAVAPQLYTLHGLQEFFRKPHLIPGHLLDAAESVISEAYAIFDEESDEEMDEQIKPYTPRADQHPH
jgi:ceramide glucosyltransferase